MPDAAKPLVIGIDAGGSKTELLVGQRGESPRQTVGPGINLHRDGLDQALRVLLDLLQTAVNENDGSHDMQVLVGVAGAGREAEQNALAEGLSTALSPSAASSITVTHDAFLAHEGAFRGKSGIVVIVGTGSIAFARTEDGQEARAGGWGNRLGDDGGGTGLGWAALRAVAHEMDGGPPTVLRDWLKREHGIDSPEALLARAGADSEWPVQHLAGLVIQAASEAHDWVSTVILKQQANALAQQAGWLATRTDGLVDKRLALVGGLMTNHDYYRECVAEALLRHLPGWRLIQPAESAVEAAFRLAAA